MEPQAINFQAVDWPSLGLELSALVATVYAAIRFLFAPRLKEAILEAIAGEHQLFRDRLHALELLVNDNERKAIAAEGAYREITESVKRLTVAMDRQIVEINAQGKSLAYIEGELRGKAMRETLQGDTHARRGDGGG